MKNELLRTLSKLFDEKLKSIQNDIKDIKNNQERIENELDLLICQTADLPKFKKETHSRLEDIKNNLISDEVITANNCKDIAKFKTVK